MAEESIVGGDRPERPRLPPGQSVVRDLPVLHAGPVPHFDLSAWRFEVFGAVAQHLELTYGQFMALPHTTVTADVHCVTGWSRFDNHWGGIAFHDVMRLVQRDPGADYVMVHAANGFTTNLALEDLMREGVLFAYELDGRDLATEHGWPLRLVVPHLYFWKSAKWVTGIEFTDQDRPGFWERRGYHMRGDPWKEERYS